MADPKFPLGVVLAAHDRVSAPFRRIVGTLNRGLLRVRMLAGRMSALNQAAGFPKLWAGFQRLGTGIGKVGQNLWSMSKRLAILGGVGVATAALLVTSFARAGDNIAKTADKLGLSVEGLQEFRFAADRAGISNEAFDKGVRAFTKTLGEAKAGTGTLVEFLKKTSPALLEQVVAAESTEEALELMLSKLQQAPDVFTRNAVAAAAFGRSGVDMTNMAKDGLAAVSDLRAEARRLGLVMSEDAARGAEKFVDSSTNLKAALTGIRNVVVGAVLPQLQSLIDRLTELVVKFRPRIQAFAEQFAATLPQRLADIRQGIADVVERLRPFIDAGRAIVERFGPVNTVLGLLAAIIVGKVVVALAVLVPAIYTLGAAILTTPVGWILMGLTALAALFVVLWKRSEKFRAVVTAVFKGLRAALGPVFEWLLDKLERIAGWFTGLLPDWLREKLGLGGGLKGQTAPAAEKARADQVVNAAAAAGVQRNESEVTVRFENAPPGLRVEPTGVQDVPLNLDLGYAGGL